MPHTTTTTAEISYQIDGSGPWLTLLHGFSQSLAIWQPQVARLSNSFRLLRIDLRGHGQSRATTGGYGPVEYASDVLAVLDDLQIGATHLWGTHTGAGVGLLLAAQHPERIATLVLDGAVIPGQPDAAVDDWQARAREVARHEGVAAARRFWFESAPFFSGIRNREEHRAIIESFSGAPWTMNLAPEPVPDIIPALMSLRQPTLIINGTNDLPSFLERARHLERLLPGTRRYLIPDAGPFPAWDAPDAVTPLVAQFLDDGE